SSLLLPVVLLKFLKYLLAAPAFRPCLPAFFHCHGGMRFLFANAIIPFPAWHASSTRFAAWFEYFLYGHQQIQAFRLISASILDSKLSMIVFIMPSISLSVRVFSLSEKVKVIANDLLLFPIFSLSNTSNN